MNHAAKPRTALKSEAPDPGERLAVRLYDGREPRARPATMHLDAGQLHVDDHADGPPRTLPVAGLTWPDRLRGGGRQLHLPDGATLEAIDTAAWDTWVHRHRLRRSVADRLQQSWRATLLAGLVVLLAGAAGLRWGVPLAAQGVVALVPDSVDREVTDRLWPELERRMFKPSELPTQRQRDIEALVADLIANGPAGHELPMPEVRFRRITVGPNALALPGGVIVVGDELVHLLGHRDDVLIGVLAHELGHLQHRHGMRALAQVTLLGLAASIVTGDANSLVAALPVLAGQLAYSRDAEREADDVAIARLQAAGVSPLVMVELFRRLQAQRDDDGEPARPAPMLSTHPPDDERIARFQDAARR